MLGDGDAKRWHRAECPDYAPVRPEPHVFGTHDSYLLRVRQSLSPQARILFWASMCVMALVLSPSMYSTQSPTPTPAWAAFPPGVSCRTDRVRESWNSRAVMWEQRDILMRAGTCRGPGSPSPAQNTTQSRPRGRWGPQITPHFPVHEPRAASSPWQQQNAKHYSRALPSPCPLAWLGTLPAPRGLITVTPNTEAVLPWPQQEAQPPLGLIPVVPGQEESTVSQGPHLTANHRHVQPFSWGGEGQGRHPLGTSPSRPSSCPVPSRRRHYLIPTEEQEPSRARETPAPTHVAPLGQLGAQPRAPLPGHSARDAPCPCCGSMARLYINPMLGSGGCPPLPPGMHSQRRAGPGAPHTAPRH